MMPNDNMEQMIREQIAEMNVAMAKLQAEAVKTSGRLKTETEEQLQRMRKTRDDAEKALDEFRKNSDTAMITLQDGMRDTLEAMNKAVADAMERYNRTTR